MKMDHFGPAPYSPTRTLTRVIATMEAVLIEGLEPRQNRKRGDDFQAAEFSQVEDPEIERQRQSAVMKQIMAKAGF